MKKKRIVVVGGLAAGPSAAAKARRVNPAAEVALYEAGETVSYGICEAPYAISGLIEDEGRLVVYTPERLQREKGIEVHTLHRVERIIPSKKTIVVRDLRHHDLVEREYDALILAMGASPRRLGLGGEDSRNVFHLSSRDDTLGILGALASERPKEAVIIGGGYIGMEMSEALRARGMDVTLVHRHRLPMEGLEEETRQRILETLQQNGVDVVTNATVEELQAGRDARIRHVVTNRGSFASDVVLLSTGVEPNVALAKQAKIRLGPTGAIATDERQQTSADGIYAAGDCCEVRNAVLGKPMYLPLATLASRAAWVAGENAAGGRAVFRGAIRAIAVKVFGMEVAQVGIGSGEAKAHGIQTVSESITAYSTVGVMPGADRISIRLIVDRKTQRLLGANVIGGKGAVLRANTLGVAIQHRMTLDDIARFDLIYAPPFAPLWDPILVAANQAKKKFSS